MNDADNEEGEPGTREHLADEATTPPMPPPVPQQPVQFARPVDTSPKKRKFPVKLLLAALAFAILVIAAAISFFLWGRAAFTPVVNEIMDAYNREDHESCYAITDLDFRSVCSKEQLENLFATLHQSLGDCRSHTITSFNAFSGTAGRTARLNCSAEFERGSGTIDIGLSKPGDKWLLSQITFNSPALAGMSKCPNCGDINPPNARLCGGCGKQIGDEASGGGQAAPAAEVPDAAEPTGQQ